MNLGGVEMHIIFVRSLAFTHNTNRIELLQSNGIKLRKKLLNDGWLKCIILIIDLANYALKVENLVRRDQNVIRLDEPFKIAD